MPPRAQRHAMARAALTYLGVAVVVLPLWAATTVLVGGAPWPRAVNRLLAGLLTAALSSPLWAWWMVLSGWWPVPDPEQEPRPRRAG